MQGAESSSKVAFCTASDLGVSWKLHNMLMGVQVLIFSHSVRMLRIIREVVTRRGYVHSWLDGSTPVKNRQRLCDEFNKRPAQFLFLISTTAGGLGLNLTAANK